MTLHYKREHWQCIEAEEDVIGGYVVPEEGLGWPSSQAGRP